WLRPIECARIEGNRIVLRAPNQYVRLWFESNYLPTVLAEMRHEDERDFLVEFEVADPAPRPAVADATAQPVMPPGGPSGGPTPGTDEPFIVPAEASPAEPVSAPGLNPKYRFETFVAGPSNQLAHAAARAVASPDPPKYNPLFI